MDCDDCQGKGYKTEISIDPNTDREFDFFSCDSCLNQCQICGDTGKIMNYDEHDELSKYTSETDCPACWSWKKCPRCIGQGTEEYGAYDPSLGHFDGYVDDCPECGGDGRIKEWSGNGFEPNERNEFDF